MDTLTTKELNAYRVELQNLMDSDPAIDGAGVLTALQTFDSTKQNERLLHAVKNFVRQRTPQPANDSGVVGVTITSAGTGYAVGDVIEITSDKGVGAIVAVETVGGTGDVLTVLIHTTGVGYTEGDIATSTAGDGTFAGAVAIGTVQADEKAIIDYLLANL
jgi:hypothetical protein